MTEKGMSFSFGYTAQEKTDKALQNLDKKKACQENDIPVKIIKSNKNIYFLTLYIINSMTCCAVQFLPRN